MEIFLVICYLFQLSPSRYNHLYMKPNKKKYKPKQQEPSSTVSSQSNSSSNTQQSSNRSRNTEKNFTRIRYVQRNDTCQSQSGVKNISTKRHSISSLNYQQSHCQKKSSYSEIKQRTVKIQIMEFIYLWVGDQILQEKLKTIEIFTDKKSNILELRGLISMEEQRKWRNYLQYFGFIQGDIEIPMNKLKKIESKIILQAEIQKKINKLYAECSHPKIKKLRNQVENQENFIILQFEKSEKKEIQKIISENSKTKTKKVQEQSDGSEGDEAEYSFYQMQEGKQNFTKKEKKKSQVQIVTKEKTPEKSIERSSEAIFSATYLKKIFDKDDFVNWIKNNQNINEENVDIKEKANTDKIEIKLYSKKRTQHSHRAQIKSLKLYLENKRIFLLLDKKCMNMLKQIEDKFCKADENGVKCEIIRGYCSEQDEKTILREYEQKKCETKHEKYRNYFKAVLIVGLKNVVEETYKEIQSYIAELPEQNLSIEILLSLDNNPLKQFLQDSHVKNVVQGEIRDIFQESYSTYTLKNIVICFCQVTLELEIEPGLVKQFEDKYENKLRKCLNEEKVCFAIDNISQIQFHKLSESFLLREDEDDQTIYLISKSKESTKMVSKLHREKQSLRKQHEQLIEIDRKFFTSIRQFMDKLSKQEMQWKEENVSLNYQEQKDMIRILGSRIYVEFFAQMINEKINELKENILVKNLRVSEKQAAVFERLMQEKKVDSIDKYKIDAKVDKNLNYGAVISLDKEKQYSEASPLIIYIQNSFNLEILPFGFSFYFRSKQEIEKFKDISLNKLLVEMKNPLNQSVTIEVSSASRGGKYIYNQDYQEDLSGLVTHQMNSKMGNDCNIGFVMRKQQKGDFIMKIVKQIQPILQNHPDYRIKIYICEQPDVDIQKQYSLSPYDKGHLIQKNSYKFYVTENKTEYFYADIGNDKIMKAYQQNKGQVYLDHNDVNMNIKTHDYYKQQKCIVHKKSGLQTKVEVYPHKIISKFNDGTPFEFPKSEFDLINTTYSNNVEITLGFYQIIFSRMVQINRFSNFQRRLQFKNEAVTEFQFQFNMNINYSYEVSQIKIFYHKNLTQIIPRIASDIKDLIDNQKKKQIKKLSEKQVLDDRTLNDLKTHGQEFNVEVQYRRDRRQITFSSFDANSISFIQHIFSVMLENRKTVEKEEISYPMHWSQDQSKEIQTFTIDPNSWEFREVQNAAPELKIVELLRIQNRIVYKKYFEEKMFLKNYINNKKDVKELKLFHGTRTTDPKVIYEDREQSFNINYTSDSNTMGRGTYFAQRAAYSINYAHSTTQATGGGFFGILGSSRNIKEMFYCLVLVGDSQPITTRQSERRDTDYKNPMTKVRYESTTAVLQGSNIFVVYKNRRAYPLYLIRFDPN